MIEIKYLFNVLAWLLILAIIYNVFFFGAIPRLIKHLRKASSRRREYDREIEEIQSEDDEPVSKNEKVEEKP